MMKVKYIGKTSPLELTNGRIYTVISVERNWYRLKDDTGEDYLYPSDQFEVIKQYLNIKRSVQSQDQIP